MEKLRSLNFASKILISVLLIGLSPVLMKAAAVSTLGFVFLFGGLFVLFEGFGLSLFLKIMIALVLGLLLALSNMFVPADLVAIKPVGSKIFMNFLTMALVPLVFSSILTGVTSLGDIHKLNRIGAKTILYYISTTAVAISIGLFFANVINPGKGISPELRQKFETQYSGTADSKVTKAEDNKQSLFQTIQSIVPKNIMNVASDPKPNMLALIFFAVMCGIALLKIDSKVAEPIITFFSSITEMTVNLVMMAMHIAPYGVFSLIAATIAATQSTELLSALVPFSICVLLGLFTHAFGTNTVVLKVFARLEPIALYKKMKSVLITAFSTASSGATMPMTLETVEKEIGVKNEVAGFVVPLGATINMDGTALFQGVSAIFLANIYGIPLGLEQQLTIVGMAVMASIGTAAVPGVGIVILTMILVSVNIPPEGILFILPVNNLLDMFRTAVNVMGDMTCAIFINKTEGYELEVDHH